MKYFHHKEWLTTPIAIIIAGALIAIGLYAGVRTLNTNIPNKSAQQAKEQVPLKLKTVTAKDHILGDINAKVLIVEYSDTECPFCKKLHPTLKKLVDTYGKDGSVAWVYRHFPIDSIHPRARKEAEATECAAELGGNDAFWQYLNKIYEITPGNNKLDPSELPRIAGLIGLDTKAFNECLSSGRYATTIEESIKDGVTAGASGTPFSVLVSKSGLTPIKGAVPYENFEKIFQEVLNKK